MVTEVRDEFKESWYSEHMAKRLIYISLIALTLSGCYGGAVRLPFAFGPQVQRSAMTSEERAAATDEVYDVMPMELRIDVLTIEDAVVAAEGFQLRYVSGRSRVAVAETLHGLPGWSVEEIVQQDHTTLLLRSSSWDVVVTLVDPAQRPIVLVTGTRVSPL
ncbi:MAG: hypothetical protein ACOYBJ_02120 [Patescibacteria group bacterium]|jgi:hypothetical protein